jgi:hypothetical protein
LRRTPSNPTPNVVPAAAPTESQNRGARETSLTTRDPGEKPQMMIRVRAASSDIGPHNPPPYLPLSIGTLQ